MLGVNNDTVIIYFTVTRNVVLAPIIGQVRPATVVQLHLTLSDGCKVKPRKGETGSLRSAHSRPGGRLRIEAVGRYLTTE